MASLSTIPQRWSRSGRVQVIFERVSQKHKQCLNRLNREGKPTGTVNQCLLSSGVSYYLDLILPSTLNLWCATKYFSYRTPSSASIVWPTGEQPGWSEQASLQLRQRHNHESRWSWLRPVPSSNRSLVFNSSVRWVNFWCLAVSSQMLPSVGDAISRGLWPTWIGPKELPPILSPCHQLFSELPLGLFNVCKHKDLPPIFLSRLCLTIIPIIMNSSQNC